MAMITSSKGLVISLFVACLYLSGCASQPLNTARKQFNTGQYETALQTLNEPEEEIANRDRLLVFLYKGMILHHLGEYEESSLQLLQAADLVGELARVSVSEQAATLIVNEWLATYKGEYSEQLWIHSYLMMNFLLLNKPESAAVEARRALKVFSKHEKSLKQDAFSRALIALSFEEVGLINDAYLEYKILAEELEDATPVADLLYRYALQLGIDADIKRYKESISDVFLERSAGKAGGELVLFVAEGQIPRKHSGTFFLPPETRISWPEYTRNHTPATSFNIKDENDYITYVSIETDLVQLAKKSLSDRGKSIAIKQIARVGVKSGLVNQLERENPLAGGLLQVALFVLEEADTRGWDTLPGRLKMLRIPLSVGTHNISIIADQGLPTEHALAYFPNVTITKGNRVYQKIRINSISR